MKYWILLLFVICNGRLFAQNLVPNPSFELFKSCPYTTGDIHLLEDWFSPSDGSPDFFSVCGIDQAVQVPSNIVGFQQPQNGNSYTGILLSEDVSNSSVVYREYIEAKLTYPLTAGSKYFFSMYVSLADSSRYSSDDFGAYLSDDTLKGLGYENIPVNPQIRNQEGFFQTDKQNWIPIQGTMIADGGESFITIGNFFDNGNTDTLFTPGGGTAANGYNLPYYYIDKICLSPDSNTCAVNTGINNMTSLVVKAFPNPTTGQINFTGLSEKKIVIDVFDVNGNFILSKVNPTSLDLSEFENGIYYAKIMIDNIQLSQKIVLIN